MDDIIRTDARDDEAAFTLYLLNPPALDHDYQYSYEPATQKAGAPRCVPNYIAPRLRNKPLIDLATMLRSTLSRYDTNLNQVSRQQKGKKTRISVWTESLSSGFKPCFSHQRG